MAPSKKESLAPQKGNRDSGRTLGRMLSRGKVGGSESRPLRAKNQLVPLGRDRFPLGKYRSDGVKIDAHGRQIKEK